MPRLSKEEHQRRYSSVRRQTGQGRENVQSAEAEAARRQLAGGKAATRSIATPDANQSVAPVQERVQRLDLSTQASTPAEANFSSIAGSQEFVPPPASEGVGADSPNGFVDFVSNVARGGFQRNEQGQLVTPDGQVVQGGTPAFLGISGGAIGAIRAATRTTKVAEAAKVGKLSADAKKATSVAGSIPVNTASAKKTSSWLSRLARGATNPTAIVGTLMGALGSYPFAGFIKEEALQTVGFATKTAIDNGDFVGAEESIQLQKEILDPDLWDRIKNGVPYANVLNQLNNFYEAARLKLSVDERVVSDLKEKTENGESDADFWARIDEERKAAKEEERAADEEYWAEIERQRKDAKAAERKEDEAYWANVLGNRSSQEGDREEYDDAYWTEYYKTMQKYRDDNTPSKLNFGLI